MGSSCPAVQRRKRNPGIECLDLQTIILLLTPDGSAASFSATFWNLRGFVFFFFGLNPLPSPTLPLVWHSVACSC